MRAYRLTRQGPAWRPAFATPLQDPEALLGGRAARLLKPHGGGRTVARVVIDGIAIVVKVFDESRPKHMLARLLAGSAAARGASGLTRLAEAGFHVPGFVATLETNGLVTAWRSCLVTEFVSGEPAESVWAQLTGPDRLRFAAHFGGHLRAIHACGLYPQDARVANWLVADKSRSDLVLVDLDRVRRYRRLAWSRRLKNLVQLQRWLAISGSPEEQDSFLRAYLGSERAGEIDTVRATLVQATRRKQAELERRARASAGSHRC